MAPKSRATYLRYHYLASVSVNMDLKYCFTTLLTFTSARLDLVALREIPDTHRLATTKPHQACQPLTLSSICIISQDKFVHLNCSSLVDPSWNPRIAAITEQRPGATECGQTVTNHPDRVRLPSLIHISSRSAKKSLRQFPAKVGYFCHLCIASIVAAMIPGIYRLNSSNRAVCHCCEDQQILPQRSFVSIAPASGMIAGPRPNKDQQVLVHNESETLRPRHHGMARCHHNCWNALLPTTQTRWKRYMKNNRP